MEVRRFMVAVEPPDDDSEKSAQLGHRIISSHLLLAAAIGYCGQYLLHGFINPRSFTWIRGAQSEYN
jgi:hypothetical protein